MQLDLTDGTTTIILSTGSNPTRGVTYFPLPPDGGDAISVTDSAEIMLRGTDAEIRTLTHQVEQMLETARQRQQWGAGPRIWVEYRPVASDVMRRSLVFGGRLAWSTRPELRQLRDSAPTVVVTLTFERQPFWEDPLVELPLASATQGTPATNGRTITNASQGWVQIAGSDVVGVLPAPVKISLKNTTGSSQDYRNFYMGVGAFNDAANFTHILEGEAGSGGFSTVGSGTCSGGNYGSATVGGGTALRYWSLPSATTTRCAGRTFRILARFAVVPTATIYITPILRDSTALVNLSPPTGEVAVGPSSGQLVDLGALAIPPSPNAQTYDNLTLCWSIRAPDASTFGVDFIQLTPTDKLRLLRQRGLSLVANEAAVDDNTEDEAYSDDGSNKFPVYAWLGDPVMVWPGRTQRIYTLQDQGGGSMVIANSLSVRAWYRARWTTV